MNQYFICPKTHWAFRIIMISSCPSISVNNQEFRKKARSNVRNEINRCIHVAENKLTLFVIPGLYTSLVTYVHIYIYIYTHKHPVSDIHEM